MMTRLALAAACLTLAACGLGSNSDDPQGSTEGALSAIALPGVLQAESFKAGAEGVAYHDTTAKNLGGTYRTTTAVDLFATSGGYAVGWIVAGEWLAYDVTVAQAAVFSVSARVASAKTGDKAFHLEVDGKAVASGTFSDASGWDTWSTASLGSFPLGAGAHSVRFVADSSSFNLDALTFTATPLCKARFPGDPGCNGTLYFGAAVEGGKPATLEAKTGKAITVYRSYFQGDETAAAFVTRASDDVANGRIPLISTKLPGSWAAVAAGQHDAWLVSVIKGLATVKGPVWFCLHHEPTGDGVPADWVAMQQHARKLIDANASNIALVGILNGWDFLKSNPQPQVWNHPVGSGVHVMGFDSYNGWSPTNGKAWKSADVVFSPGPTIASWGYPTLVGEYGVRSDPKAPGKAAAWMKDAYDYAVAHDFVALSYFDSGANSPDGTWALDSETLPAFTTNLGRAETAHP